MDPKDNLDDLEQNTSPREPNTIEEDDREPNTMDAREPNTEN